MCIDYFVRRGVDLWDSGLAVFVLNLSTRTVRSFLGQHDLDRINLYFFIDVDILAPFQYL
jgi:hypothetical protein